MFVEKNVYIFVLHLLLLDILNKCQTISIPSYIMLYSVSSIFHLNTEDSFLGIFFSHRRLKFLKILLVLLPILD